MQDIVLMETKKISSINHLYAQQNSLQIGMHQFQFESIPILGIDGIDWNWNWN
jgi:hypothetical protein